MIRAAIVGLGWWGQTIARSLASSEIIKPVLGIDPLEADARQGCSLGLETAARFEDALARPDIEAVILCTPQDHHAGQIEAAAKSGRHVFCEKPLVHHRRRRRACYRHRPAGQACNSASGTSGALNRPSSRCKSGSRTANSATRSCWRETSARTSF